MARQILKEASSLARGFKGRVSQHEQDALEERFSTGPWPVFERALTSDDDRVEWDEALVLVLAAPLMQGADSLPQILTATTVDDDALDKCRSLLLALERRAPAHFRAVSISLAKARAEKASSRKQARDRKRHFVGGLVDVRLEKKRAKLVEARDDET
jgi:hypothetical protein